jgi:hypothetical protein
MGSSTVSLQSVVDNVTTQGAPSPLAHPSGYGNALALDIGNDVMSDLINERFNWKWNRKTAPPIYTNSWQQDYPCVGNIDIGWLETADRVDINNSSRPLPLMQITARKDLPRTSYSRGPIREVCWLYNKDLVFGTWPGAQQTFQPLVGTNPMVTQNPLMSMIDANGNMLIVTTFGTTGLSAPVLPASSIEGTTVIDGTVTWTVVSPDSKGFRVFPLPGATGPVYQITPIYQVLPPTFIDLQQLLDPIPDDQARHFRRGYRAYCFDASSNPADKPRFESAYREWIESLLDIRKDGDKELNAYGLLPAGAVVDDIYPGLRNPQDPSQPY